MEPTNYANTLPIEIWRECFMLLSKGDHKNLAETCRFFHGICLAFLFKSITHSSEIVFLKKHSQHHLIGQMEKLMQDYERFTEVAFSPRLAPLVRKCTLKYSLRLTASVDKEVASKVKACYDPFSKSFIKTIPFLPNLREVEIEFLKTMDKKILAALAALPHLDRLSFLNVRFGAHSLKPLIKVRKIAINNRAMDWNPNGSAKRLDVFSGERLEDLSVISEVYAPKIFLTLASQGNCQHLTCLSFQLKPEDMPTLYAFLAVCAKLESLTMDFGYRVFPRSTPFPRLPQSTIPNLKSFSGPATAAQVFVPGRPVNKVRLGGLEIENEARLVQLRNTFSHLSQSTELLTDLDLGSATCNSELMALIVFHFPNLIRLYLDLYYEMIFPDQNPDDLNPDSFDEAGTADLDSNPESRTPDLDDELQPALAHNLYMNIIQRMALRKIDLPMNLDSLYFQTPLYTLYLMTTGICSKPYTVFKANSVFKELSSHYPSLHNVVIGESKSQQLFWKKDRRGSWSFSKVY